MESSNEASSIVARTIAFPTSEAKQISSEENYVTENVAVDFTLLANLNVKNASIPLEEAANNKTRHNSTDPKIGADKFFSAHTEVMLSRIPVL